MSHAQSANFLFLTLASLALLSGCTISKDPVSNDPQYAPVLPASSAIPKPNSGGIYRPDYSLSLFEDGRATRVGDTITVILNERTQSSKTADTEITKESSITSDAGRFLGLTPSGKYTLQNEASHDREIKGEASSDQSNSLNGNITVTVARVLPNGLLHVRGEKWMTLNRGKEFIRVSGFIRPQDVRPDNTVLSTRLADARIAYSGTGDLANANKSGWASRFFNSEYWPF